MEENEDWLLVLQYTEAIMVSEKISSMLSSHSFQVIGSSSVYQYIEKTTPKINEYQQSHSEPIPSIKPALLCNSKEPFQQLPKIQQVFIYKNYLVLLQHNVTY